MTRNGVQPTVAASERTGGPGAARSRVVEAALVLFAQHGVSGTSLQMIATELGVTKAAVYHQFKTKAEIARAVAEAELDRVHAVLDRAEREGTAARARNAAIEGMVDLAVERRHQATAILSDPMITGLFAHDRGMSRLVDRLVFLLLGEQPSREGQVAVVMLTAAISGAVMHPMVAGTSDEELRAQLLVLARRFLRVAR